MGASLHDVDEKDEDNNGGKGEEEEDDDNTLEDTPRDEVKEGEEHDDDIRVIDADPTPSKHWTQSQQAQRDEKESSLVKEILSDDEKLQRSQMEAEKVSKERASASSSSNQQSSRGEGSGSVSKEFDHQESGKEGGEELTILICQAQHQGQGSHESPLRGSRSVLRVGQPFSTECPRCHHEHSFHSHCSLDP